MWDLCQLSEDFLKQEWGPCEAGIIIPSYRRGKGDTAACAGVTRKGDDSLMPLHSHSRSKYFPDVPDQKNHLGPLLKIQRARPFCHLPEWPRSPGRLCRCAHPSLCPHPTRLLLLGETWMVKSSSSIWPGPRDTGPVAGPQQCTWPRQGRLYWKQLSEVSLLLHFPPKPGGFMGFSWFVCQLKM